MVVAQPQADDMCVALHQLLGALERFSFPFHVNRIPFNGITVLFEAGEQAHGLDRIVRVETHTEYNQLRLMLQAEFVKEQKDHSLFRRNIGRALLNREQDPFLEQWNWDLTSRAQRAARSRLLNRDKQKAVEQQVSAVIRDNFSFVVLELENKAERVKLADKIASTVARCAECRPSAEWLGRHSPEAGIRESGLWQVYGLSKPPLSAPEFAALRELVGSVSGS